jgi:beta-glucanase (GH16 family)
MSINFELLRKFIMISLFSLWILIFINCSSDKTDNITDSNPNDTIPSIPGWQLVWNDEFSGPDIDATKWTHEVNGDGGGNNELQYYTARDSNSLIIDGNLVIVAKKEKYTVGNRTWNYTSARLNSRNKGDWKYGRFDIRAKLPYGQGMWPAIWMMPKNEKYGGWAASGEIDIMELLGQEPTRVYGTLHYGGTYPNNTHTGSSLKLKSGNFAEKYHLFTLEWEEDEFRWYMDGNLYLIQNDWYTNSAEYPAPFDQEFYLILNVAVGGNWPGNPDETTYFPQVMVIDYIRVYKKAE